MLRAVLVAEACRLPDMTAVHLIAMNSRAKLHVFVDELTDAEADATLARLLRERQLLTQWASSREAEASEDAWAMANAREAIREEPW
jgi:hypothetical protein